MIAKLRSIPIALDMVIAILIALTTLSTALAAWRTNMVNSLASNANRQGLINAIKLTAGQGVDWQKVYEEAGYARDYLVEVAAANAMEDSGASQDAIIASNLRQYLIPGLGSLAGPMGTTSNYRQADGTLDAQKRFLELQGQDPSLSGADPEKSFKQAAQFFQEQRFLTVGTVLLAISVFWLGLAEISPKGRKAIPLAVGVLGFLGSLAYLGVVEMVFVLVKGVAA